MIKSLLLVIVSILFMSTFSYGSDFDWTSTDSDLIGKSVEEINKILKTHNLELKQYQCGSSQQDACQKNYMSYCNCLGFALNDTNKPLESKNFTLVIRDEKVVDYKIESTFRAAHVWDESKENVEKVKVNYFSKGKAPYNLHFDQFMPLDDLKLKAKNNADIARYIAQWNQKNGTEIAAVLWCQHEGKKLKGKIRDCFVSEASFSKIRKFTIPKNTNKFNF